MPHCYFLTVCSGSSVDQHSNNATLFNLVEQINVPPGAPPPPRGLIPLEMHAYFVVSAGESGESFEMRFVMVAATGLETPTESFMHRAVAPRFRTRTMGLPFPPVTGQYELHVDVRSSSDEAWRREALSWPMAIVEFSPKPRVTH
jgi:hypothetical protein